MGESDEATIYVALSGDLILHVTNSKEDGADETGTDCLTKTLTVSSTVMCLASPVWKAMLDPRGHFLEANSSRAPGSKEVTFYDDDVNALLLLLNIAHLNFDKLPGTVDLDGLWKIAVLCDKYDMVRVIRPWLPKWTEPFKDRQGAKWAFIAWTSGDQSTFNSTVRIMVMNSRVSSSGDLLDESGKPYGKVMPPDLMGKLSMNRFCR